jgi:hypothetical protein
MISISEYFIWVANGFLVIAYYAADHLATLVLLGALGAFVWTAEDAQRGWAAGAGLLALIASLVAPAPVPLLLLLMSGAGWAAVWLERYNRPAQRWNVIRGIACMRWQDWDLRCTSNLTWAEVFWETR